MPVSGSGAPTKGAVSINKDTGAFAYQPSTGARLTAQTTSVPDFDTFTVNVNDGQVTTPVTVTVAGCLRWRPWRHRVTLWRLEVELIRQRWRCMATAAMWPMPRLGRWR